jgi:phage shock protein A
MTRKAREDRRFARSLVSALSLFEKWEIRRAAGRPDAPFLSLETLDREEARNFLEQLTREQAAPHKQKAAECETAIALAKSEMALLQRRLEKLQAQQAVAMAKSAADEVHGGMILPQSRIYELRCAGAECAVCEAGLAKAREVSDEAERELKQARASIARIESRAETDAARVSTRYNKRMQYYRLLTGRDGTWKDNILQD